MKEITILEIIFVVFLLLSPIVAAYLGIRVLKQNKRFEQLQEDRNKALEKMRDALDDVSKLSNKLRLKGIEIDKLKKEMCSDILFRTITDGEKFIGELLSATEKKMIIAALNMPEYAKAITEPKAGFQVRKVYRDLKEKIKESLK